MRASEDNADHEFVFVANKVMTRRECSPGVGSGSPRPPRTLPFLNHLQPIPTNLDLQPSPRPWLGYTPPTSTTSVAKATPLPQELIDLLPPHLRENTVVDPPTSNNSSVEDVAPKRPPLPTRYCPGDYYNLDDTPAPLLTTTAPNTATSTSSTSSSPHNYSYLSDLITSDALSVLTATHTHGHSGRATSLSGGRPAPTNTCTSHKASHTAPAALALTDSGISSGGSSSNSSVSSRSSSSKSLPREGSNTSLTGRPLQPPNSPKFARSPLAATIATVATATVTTSCTVATAKDAALPRVSYTAVLTSDGERAAMVRRVDALTSSASPLLSTFRAAQTNMDQTHPDPRYRQAYTPVHPGHTRAPSTAGITNQAPKPFTTPTHTPSHTPSTTPSQTPTAVRRVVCGPIVSPVQDAALIRSSPAAARRILPGHKDASPTPSSPRPHIRQINGRPPEVWSASPPPSPELRRAWNVVGLPMVGGGVHSVAHSPAPRPRVPPTSTGPDLDGIYDNLVLRHAHAAAPMPRNPPTASVTPITHHGTPPPLRKFSPSPFIGKPPSPSPPLQRRASPSPTPPAWVSQGVGVRAVGVGGQDGGCGGCWVPVWGSSPQLHHAPGSTPVYPAYVYHGPPPELMCEGRSRSCERLPARPSPPSSPRGGRRSASPWRGGSPSGVRHSPSPDPVSGRPPRPRRPPMRKSKTVEVGYLGVGMHGVSSSGLGMGQHGVSPSGSGVGQRGASSSGSGEATPLPVHSITYLQGPPLSGVPSTHVYIQPINHCHTPPPPSPHHACSPPRSTHARAPHEGPLANGFHESGVVTAACAPSGPTVARGASPANSIRGVSVPPDIGKSKVTYKSSSFYKCMKNLLKPIQ